MAGTIGYDSAAGQAGTSISSAVTHRMLIDAFTYTAVANDEITDIGFHCGTFVGDGSGIEIGVYDITGGAGGATLIATATIASPTTGARNNVSITPVSLVAGNEYAMAERVISATNISILNSYLFGATRASTLDGTTPLAASFTNNANAGNKFSLFATVATASSVSITDINTNNEIDENEQDNVATTSGFVDPITTFKMVQGAFETDLTSIVDVAGVVTADAPDFTSYDGVASSPIGTSANNAIIARLGNGTDGAADLAITVNPRTSYSLIEVLTASKADGSIYKNVVEAVPDQSQHYYDAQGGDLLIDPDGIVFYNGTTNFSVWWWNKTTGITTRIDVLVSSSGMITTMISPMITPIITPIIS